MLDSYFEYSAATKFVMTAVARLQWMSAIAYGPK